MSKRCERYVVRTAISGRQTAQAVRSMHESGAFLQMSKSEVSGAPSQMHVRNAGLYILRTDERKRNDFTANASAQYYCQRERFA